MAHVAPWKKEVVKNLEDIIKNYQTVAVVKVDRIPGIQLQEIRANLRGKATFMVAKKNLIMLALENSRSEKEGIEKLSDHIDGQVALLGTDMNPFSIFRILDNNTKPLPAKGGEEAPQDIVVDKGETSFPPGPIVGEFGKAGIPASIEKGKVVIKKKTTPVKKGEMISRNLAQMLTKLEIFPFEAGVTINGAWEEGVIYEPGDLDIDMEEYRKDLTMAASMAVNLAVFTAYTTPLTAIPILTKAHGEAMNLAVNSGILNEKSAELILSKAYGNALAIASALSAEAMDEELQALLRGAATAQQETEPVEEDAADKKEEEPEEEEEPSEEEAAAGLGALFG